jgi:hypothetical protein
MKQIIIIILIFLSSCRENTNDNLGQELENEEKITEEKYLDGTYCAEVKYYNPNTGTNSTYMLTVEVESKEVKKVNFPSGYLDESNFNEVYLNENGSTSFVSDKGYIYEVQIKGNADDCFTDNISKAIQCKGITKNGNQCMHLTDNSDGLCWQHKGQ